MADAAAVLLWAGFRCQARALVATLKQLGASSATWQMHTRHTTGHDAARHCTGLHTGHAGLHTRGQSLVTNHAFLFISGSSL